MTPKPDPHAASDTASRQPETALPAALSGARFELATAAGHISCYVDNAGSPARPLLLVHSVNAAASAYEVRPLFDHYRSARPVYAIDLPGYGFSERSDRRYSARLMTDAVLAVAAEIAARHGGAAIDALAVSLGAEFLARAAAERPHGFRSVALVSPTGLDRAAPREGAPESDRGQAWLLATFGRAPWSPAFFRFLTRPGVIRFFLAKTWGSPAIDEGLLAYDVVTTKQPGARFAPFYFVSGFLFSADITRVYDGLTGPVWVVHGTRGDFVNYRGLARYASNPLWTIDVMATGALPYFEDLAGFTARYDAFSAAVSSSASSDAK